MNPQKDPKPREAKTMQNYTVMDEFGNEDTLAAETPADAIARWSKSYEQNPLIHQVEVQAHTERCGGTCWEKLNNLGPECLATTVHLEPGPPATDRQRPQSYTIEWDLPNLTAPQVAEDLARIAQEHTTSSPDWCAGSRDTPGPLHSTTPCIWPTRGQDMARLSNLHPQVTFTLECRGQRDQDRRREYHRQGAMQNAQGRWTYDPPDPQGFAPTPGSQNN